MRVESMCSIFVLTMILAACAAPSQSAQAEGPLSSSMAQSPQADAPMSSMAKSDRAGAPLLSPMPTPVPLAKDLCSDPEERLIRERIKAAHGQAERSGEVVVPGGEALVPCEHGVLRYFQFGLSKHEILLVVEKDDRPSYLSGGAHHRSLAVIDGALVWDHEGLWKRIRNEDGLAKEDIVNLMVAVLMLRSQPEMIVNDQQRQEKVTHWPETKRAFELDPPGLRHQGDGVPILQAWTTRSYNERGVSCRHLEGWQLTYDPKAGIKVLHNHSYASGTDMGAPCGAKLP